MCAQYATGPNFFMNETLALFTNELLRGYRFMYSQPDLHETWREDWGG